MKRTMLSSPPRLRGGWWAAALALTAILGACKGGAKKLSAGAPCDVSTPPSCDGQVGYLCDLAGGGKVQEVACKGPKGCAIAGAKLECDFSGDAVGDACPFSDDGQAMCSADKRRKIACRDRKVAIEQCRGAKGCAIESGATHCDHAVAEEGDACGSDIAGAGGGYACSLDKKDSLQCRAGKYVLDAHCRGASGCVPGAESSDGKLHCDSSVQLEGDPCDAAQLAHFACSVNGRTLLKCTGTAWAKDETCAGNKKCAREGEKIGCK